MRGYQAWSIHKAIALHLSSLKYDVFKVRGHVRGNSMDHYAKVKARFPFEFAESQCKDKQELVQYFVSNFAYSKDDGCYDLSTSWDRYKLWIKRKECMTQLALEYLETFDPRMVCARGDNCDIPLLMYEVIAGKVTPEVAVIVNRHTPYIDAWLAEDYTGLNRYSVLIKKLDRFVRYNEARISDFLKEKWNEETI